MQAKAPPADPVSRDWRLVAREWRLVAREWRLVATQGTGSLEGLNSKDRVDTPSRRKGHQATRRSVLTPVTGGHSDKRSRSRASGPLSKGPLYEQQEFAVSGSRLAASICHRGVMGVYTQL